MRHLLFLLLLESATVHADDDPYRRTDVLVWTATGLAGLHVTDNALSGRSFSGHTPSTVTQPLYLLLPLSRVFDAGPLWNVTMATSMLVAHATGHYVPSSENALSTFHTRWTDRSNRLDVDSPVLGRASQATLVALDVTLLAVLASSIADGIEHGFTLRERRPAAREATGWRIVPVTGGLGIAGAW